MDGKRNESMSEENCQVNKSNNKKGEQIRSTLQTGSE